MAEMIIDEVVDTLDKSYPVEATKDICSDGQPSYSKMPLLDETPKPAEFSVFNKTAASKNVITENHAEMKDDTDPDLMLLPRDKLKTGEVTELETVDGFQSRDEIVEQDSPETRPNVANEQCLETSIGETSWEMVENTVDLIKSNTEEDLMSSSTRTAELQETIAKASLKDEASVSNVDSNDELGNLSDPKKITTNILDDGLEEDSQLVEGAQALDLPSDEDIPKQCGLDVSPSGISDGDTPLSRESVKGMNADVQKTHQKDIDTLVVGPAGSVVLCDDGLEVGIRTHVSDSKPSESDLYNLSTGILPQSDMQDDSVAVMEQEQEREVFVPEERREVSQETHVTQDADHAVIHDDKDINEEDSQINEGETDVELAYEEGNEGALVAEQEVEDIVVQDRVLSVVDIDNNQVMREITIESDLKYDADASVQEHGQSVVESPVLDVTYFTQVMTSDKDDDLAYDSISKEILSTNSAIEGIEEIEISSRECDASRGTDRGVNQVHPVIEIDTKEEESGAFTNQGDGTFMADDPGDVEIDVSVETQCIEVCNEEKKEEEGDMEKNSQPQSMATDELMTTDGRIPSTEGEENGDGGDTVSSHLKEGVEQCLEVAVDGDSSDQIISITMGDTAVASSTSTSTASPLHSSFTDAQTVDLIPAPTSVPSSPLAAPISTPHVDVHVLSVSLMFVLDMLELAVNNALTRLISPERETYCAVPVAVEVEMEVEVLDAGLPKSRGESIQMSMGSESMTADKHEVLADLGDDEEVEVEKEEEKEFLISTIDIAAEGEEMVEWDTEKALHEGVIEEESQGHCLAVDEVGGHCQEDEFEKVDSGGESGEEAGVEKEEEGEGEKEESEEEEEEYDISFELNDVSGMSVEDVQCDPDSGDAAREEYQEKEQEMEGKIVEHGIDDSSSLLMGNIFDLQECNSTAGVHAKNADDGLEGEVEGESLLDSTQQQSEVQIETEAEEDEQELKIGASFAISGDTADDAHVPVPAHISIDIPIDWDNVNVPVPVPIDTDIDQDDVCVPVPTPTDTDQDDVGVSVPIEQDDVDTDYLDDCEKEEEQNEMKDKGKELEDVRYDQTEKEKEEEGKENENENEKKKEKEKEKESKEEGDEEKSITEGKAEPFVKENEDKDEEQVESVGAIDAEVQQIRETSGDAGAVVLNCEGILEGTLDLMDSDERNLDLDMECSDYADDSESKIVQEQNACDEDNSAIISSEEKDNVERECDGDNDDEYEEEYEEDREEEDREDEVLSQNQNSGTLLNKDTYALADGEIDTALDQRVDDNDVMQNREEGKGDGVLLVVNKTCIEVVDEQQACAMDAREVVNEIEKDVVDTGSVQMSDDVASTHSIQGGDLGLDSSMTLLSALCDGCESEDAVGGEKERDGACPSDVIDDGDGGDDDDYDDDDDENGEDVICAHLNNADAPTNISMSGDIAADIRTPPPEMTDITDITDVTQTEGEIHDITESEGSDGELRGTNIDSVDLEISEFMLRERELALDMQRKEERDREGERDISSNKISSREGEVIALQTDERTSKHSDQCMRVADAEEKHSDEYEDDHEEEGEEKGEVIVSYAEGSSERSAGEKCALDSTNENYNSDSSNNNNADRRDSNCRVDSETINTPRNNTNNTSSSSSSSSTKMKMIMKAYDHHPSVLQQDNVAYRHAEHQKKEHSVSEQNSKNTNTGTNRLSRSPKLSKAERSILQKINSRNSIALNGVTDDTKHVDKSKQFEFNSSESSKYHHHGMFSEEYSLNEQRPTFLSPVALVRILQAQSQPLNGLLTKLPLTNHNRKIPIVPQKIESKPFSSKSSRTITVNENDDSGIVPKKLKERKIGRAKHNVLLSKSLSYGLYGCCAESQLNNDDIDVSANTMNVGGRKNGSREGDSTPSMSLPSSSTPSLPPSSSLSLYDRTLPKTEISDTSHSHTHPHSPLYPHPSSYTIPHSQSQSMQGSLIDNVMKSAGSAYSRYDMRSVFGSNAEKVTHSKKNKIVRNNDVLSSKGRQFDSVPRPRPPSPLHLHSVFNTHKTESKAMERIQNNNIENERELLPIHRNAQQQSNDSDALTRHNKKNYDTSNTPANAKIDYFSNSWREKFVNFEISNKNHDPALFKKSLENLKKLHTVNKNEIVPTYGSEQEDNENVNYQEMKNKMKSVKSSSFENTDIGKQNKFTELEYFTVFVDSEGCVEKCLKKLEDREYESEILFVCRNDTIDVKTHYAAMFRNTVL